ncbi:MAG TPA: hypothetical protein VGB97_03485 [Candidatus Paceibacterota bacterium]|jgi:hypothetical protein
MLSIKSSNNGAWVNQLPPQLATGQATQKEVILVMAAALKWADETYGVRATLNRNTDKDALHYTEQFLRTQTGTPVIPKFLRAYCAFQNGIVPSEGAIWLIQPPEKKTDKLCRTDRRRKQQQQVVAAQPAAM